MGSVEARVCITNHREWVQLCSKSLQCTTCTEYDHHTKHVSCFRLVYRILLYDDNFVKQIFLNAMLIIFKIKVRCVPLWINWISIYKIPFFLNDAIDFVAGLSASPTNEGFIPWLFQRRFWLNRILNKCDFYFIPRLPEFIFLWGIFPASEFLSTSEMVTSYSICYVYVWIVSSLDIHDALNSNYFISFIEDGIM